MLSLDHVSKVYKTGPFGGTDLLAVRDVSFDIAPSEVVSLIGESGSGKSTVGKMILRLIKVDAGRIDVDGDDISTLRGTALRQYYRRVQGVFQDPFSSFNPIFKVDHLFSVLRDVYFPGLGDAEWRQRQTASLEAVNLEPGQVLHKFPHQLSGGQLQRLLIARALILETEFLVADEIISMLDASTRIDVLNLLGDLKVRGLGILFITHDLSVLAYACADIAVMYGGRIVEKGPSRDVFENPVHPYTRALAAAFPTIGDASDRMHPSGLPGDPPDPQNIPDGCPFHPRCASFMPGVCDAALPAEIRLDTDHSVRCFLYGEQTEGESHGSRIA